MIWGKDCLQEGLAAGKMLREAPTCSEADTRRVTGPALAGAVFGAQLEAFPRGLC